MASDYLKNLNFTEDWIKNFNLNKLEKSAYLKQMYVLISRDEKSTKSTVIFTYKPPKPCSMGNYSCVISLHSNHQDFIREMKLAYETIRDFCLKTKDVIEFENDDGSLTNSLPYTINQNTQVGMMVANS